jgi:excinuclease ABC subunit C
LLNEKSPALHAIIRIRDEAHRFAVTYHRSLRASREVQSTLDEIEGIGPARKKALMTQYKTMDQIKQATEEELGAVPGMNRTAAQGVFAHFHSHREDDASPNVPGNREPDGL